MPREIKILLPDSSTEEIFDIQIRTVNKENISSYRFEIWDLVDGNPDNLEAADFLKQKIKSIADHWIVAEIFAEENQKIPILLKRNN